MLTPDVRFEGWTTEDWIRFVQLWKPRAAPEREPTRPRGGVVVVYEAGQVLKLLHTHRGRLDPASALSAGPPSASAPSLSAAPVSAPPPSSPEAAPLAAAPARAVESAVVVDGDLRLDLGGLAQQHHGSWALGMRLGALDEIMERFGARARRSDDLTEQALKFVAIAQEMIAEGAITTWPQRLRGLPVPTAQVTRRTLDALCPDGHSLTLGLFDAGSLWTSFVARRKGFGFDLLAGPDELRPAMGLLSGDWRRDYRHVARAVEERYGPLGFGCFAELSTFRTLQTDTRPGAWTRAVAVRDIIIARIPVAVGVALGLDGTRYALQGLIGVASKLPPLAACAPLLGAMRSRIATVTGKDVTALLGFDPLQALRALLER